MVAADHFVEENFNSRRNGTAISFLLREKRKTNINAKGIEHRSDSFIQRLAPIRLLLAFRKYKKKHSRYASGEDAFLKKIKVLRTTKSASITAAKKNQDINTSTRQSHGFCKLEKT